MVDFIANLTFDDAATFLTHFEDEETFTTSMETVVRVVGNFEEVTVTPTQSQQIITASAGYDAIEKVTVAPIPSNYGLITWNGTTLTVS